MSVSINVAKIGPCKVCAKATSGLIVGWYEETGVSLHACADHVWDVAMMVSNHLNSMMQPARLGVDAQPDRVIGWMEPYSDEALRSLRRKQRADNDQQSNPGAGRKPRPDASP